MHQVDHHIGELAFDSFLGGVVKVKLLQFVTYPVRYDVATGMHVNQHGVAVVLQRDRRGNIVELNRLQGLVQVCAANVNG